MKTKSVAKILVVLTLASALLAAFSPTASARGDSGDQRLAADAQTKTEICIFENANICPPEPFEIVAPCITTHLIAGSECPVVHDVVGSGAGDLAANPTQGVELGGCVGIASCNDFIATCAGGGGTPHTVLDGKKGQPLVAICT